MTVVLWAVPVALVALIVLVMVMNRRLWARRRRSGQSPAATRLIAAFFVLGAIISGAASVVSVLGHSTDEARRGLVLALGCLVLAAFFFVRSRAGNSAE